VVHLTTADQLRRRARRPGGDPPRSPRLRQLHPHVRRPMSTRVRPHAESSRSPYPSARAYPRTVASCFGETGTLTSGTSSPSTACEGHARPAVARSPSAARWTPKTRPAKSTPR